MFAVGLLLLLLFTFTDLQISMIWMALPALVMAGVGIWIARVIPVENRGKALRYAAVGISRVFMGAHFASDVTAGILLSLTIFEAPQATLYRKQAVK